MTIEIPDFFFKDNSTYSLNLENLTFLNYCLYKNEDNQELDFKSNAIIIVLSGKKNIFINNEILSIIPGEIVYLKKGKYFMNITTDPDKNIYSSLDVFLLSDNFIKEFIEENKNMF